MAEEFQESEVIFRDCVEIEESIENREGVDFPVSSVEESRNVVVEMREKVMKRNETTLSAPVSIPNARLRSDWGGGEEGEFVPPHVVIGRRVAGKVAALSLCKGRGRTLKGRDLREFRNSILRMTGFLET